MSIKYWIALFGVVAALGYGLRDTTIMETIMAKRPAQKKTVETERDTFRVKGVDVLITRQGERETLQIDGKVIDFYRTESGYRLKNDVFRTPQNTLRKAAQQYLESEVQK